MNQLIIVPAYELSVMYEQHKVFSPLDKYIDFDLLLQLCFSPEIIENNSTDKIWEIIEQERMGWIDKIITHDRQENFSLDESYLEDELISFMLDFFMESSYNLFDVSYNIESFYERIKSTKVSNACLYLTTS